MQKNQELTKTQSKSIWMRAQALTGKNAFGRGPKAVSNLVEQLGYVQIDTINVIERCHHHILFSRIPGYRRTFLQKALSRDKSVFEYWTHALAYIPTRDFRYFIPAMRAQLREPESWFKAVKKEDLKRVLSLIKKEGALSIRDFQDEVLVEKSHPWGSRKPSKKALQLGFFTGQLTVSERHGMLKKYELTERHFGWNAKPKAATNREILEYLLERSLRSQGIISLDSVCHLKPSRKPLISSLIQNKVKTQELVEVSIQGLENINFWAKSEVLAQKPKQDLEQCHILSPFDPLIIMRKRLKHLFDYEHLFEAYLPKEKRKLGYFALPVLIGDQVVAAIDLKAERERKKLLIQNWTWMGKAKGRFRKQSIEEELDRFEKFQFSD